MLAIIFAYSPTKVRAHILCQQRNRPDLQGRTGRAELLSELNVAAFDTSSLLPSADCINRPDHGRNSVAAEDLEPDSRT